MMNVRVLVRVSETVNAIDDDYNDDVKTGILTDDDGDHLNYLLPYLRDGDQHQLAKFEKKKINKNCI